MTDKQKKAAISCFELDKNLQEVIVTSDGNCFTSKNLSDNHAKEARLNKADTVTISRDDVAEGKKEDAANTAEKPFSKMNKSELLDAAAKLEVEIPEGTTNKDIIALLEAKAASGADNEKGGAE